MGDQWWDNITLCEAGGHNFTQTTSTGLEFRCIVHDICKRPALSHNVRHRRHTPPTCTAAPNVLVPPPSPPPSPHPRPYPRLALGAEQNLLGIMIAMSANAVIPFALNVQKWVHEHNEGLDGKPKKHFTRIPLWWVGIVGMIGGEFFNMLAYGWAPTAIVAPVGAVGVFFNGARATQLRCSFR